MKTAFTPFTLDESSALHIQSVKRKFALRSSVVGPYTPRQSLKTHEYNTRLISRNAGLKNRVLENKHLRVLDIKLL